ncbi:MAG: cadherin-like domain-containing protein, partial [Planctomycetales bacterium]|nr:cadherin-like domain-containing protein [Planctomycetales bacterium]
EDSTLTAMTTGIADPDGLTTPNFTFQWLNNGVAIAGATSSTYTPDDGDVGRNLSVKVGFTDDRGNLTIMESSPVGPIANVNDLPNGLPAIAGTFVEKDKLVATIGSVSDDDGLPSSADFQWLRDETEIIGATDRTYVLTLDDVGHNVSVRVTYVDLHGTKETVVSKQTPTIDNFNDAPTLSDQTRNIPFGETLVVGTKLFEGASSDIDGDILKAVLVDGPKSGTLELNGDGSFRYTPESQFFGTVSFSWQADDGALLSNVATVTIVIAPPINTPGASTGSNGESGGEPTDTGSSAENETSDGTGDGSSGTETNSGGTDVTTSIVGGGTTPTEMEDSTGSTTVPISEDSSTRLVSFRADTNDDDGRSIDRGTLEDRVREIDSISSSNSRDGSAVADRNENVMTGLYQWGDYAVLGSPGEMWDQLDNNHFQLESLLEGEQLIVGSFGAATGGFTVIALAWLRNGFLVLGFWQQRPLWSRMDPLVLMQGLRSQDDESLEDVIADQRRKLDQSDGQESE